MICEDFDGEPCEYCEGDSAYCGCAEIDVRGGDYGTLILTQGETAININRAVARKLVKDLTAIL